MRYAAVAILCLLGGMATSLTPAMAGSCPGNPNAIGTSRTITVEPSAFPRIGTMQYRATMPLNDHEVAQRLEISEETVEKHRFNILRKLSLGTTAELVRYAREHGFTLAARRGGAGALLP